MFYPLYSFLFTLYSDGVHILHSLEEQQKYDKSHTNLETRGTDLLDPFQI